jgi:hypothetical protein
MGTQETIAATVTEAISEATATIGDNSRHAYIDLAVVLAPEWLSDNMEAGYGDRRKRGGELMAANLRFLAANPDGIKDDETQGRASAFARQLGDEIKSLDTARMESGAPIRQATGIVNSWWAALIDPLKNARAGVMSHIDKYAKDRADAARKTAEEEAQRKREEAANLAAMAERSGDVATMDRAIEAEQAAEDMHAAAAASPAALSRVRGDLGTTTSLRTRWSWAEDPATGGLMALVRAVAAGTQPSNLLVPNKAILDALARDKNSRSIIPGIRWVSEQRAVVR